MSLEVRLGSVLESWNVMYVTCQYVPSPYFWWGGEEAEAKTSFTSKGRATASAR